MNTNSEITYTYVLHCPGMKYPYVGQTSHLVQRIANHIVGNGSSYTKKYRPSKLIHLETQTTRKLERDREIFNAIRRGAFKPNLPIEFEDFFYRIVAALYPGDLKMEYALDAEAIRRCCELVQVPKVKGFNC